MSCAARRRARNFPSWFRAQKSSYKSNINRLEDIANPVIGRRAEEEYVPPRLLKKGDLVLVTQLGEEGVLLSDPDSAGNVQVQAGIIKTKVPVSSLRLVDKKRRRQLSRMEKKKNGGVTKTLVDKSQRSASSELDLRGQTIEEAIMMVDQFIDSCTLLGIKTITIIHGKGHRRPAQRGAAASEKSQSGAHLPPGRLRRGRGRRHHRGTQVAASPNGFTGADPIRNIYLGRFYTWTFFR